MLLMKVAVATSGFEPLAAAVGRRPRLRLSHANAIIFAPLLFIIAQYCFQLHYIVRYSPSINLAVVEQYCV